MQAKTCAMAGRQTGSMSAGGQRSVLRQAFRGTPVVGNSRAMRVGGVRTHAIDIRAEKVRASSHYSSQSAGPMDTASDVATEFGERKIASHDLVALASEGDVAHCRSGGLLELAEHSLLNFIHRGVILSRDGLP